MQTCLHRSPITCCYVGVMCCGSWVVQVFTVAGSQGHLSFIKSCIGLALLTESDGNILAHQCSVHMDAVWYSCFTIYTHRSMGHYSPSPPTAVHAVPSYLPASPSDLENFPVIFRMLSKLQHIYVCVSDH